MTTTLLKTGYPIFIPNQVLTDKDLNGVVTYLDEQSRLTRTHLIGMGIVCGMEVEAKIIEGTENIQITISSGCGITSEGYVISLPEKIVMNSAYERTVASSLFEPRQQDSPSQKGENNGQVSVTELSEQNDPENGISQEDLSNQVLVVLCEVKDQQDDSCWLSYDEQSKSRSFSLRFFLMSVPDADTLLQTGYQASELPDYWKDFKPGSEHWIQQVLEARNHFFKERNLRIHRFGHTEVGNEQSVDLTQIDDYEAFRNNYNEVCIDAIAKIGDAFPELFQLFSPFFLSFYPTSKSDFSQLGSTLENIRTSINQEADADNVEATYAWQYFYDYLSQLVAAYYELAGAAFDLMDDCMPDTSRFPKFLMLGQVLLNQPSNSDNSDDSKNLNLLKGYAIPSAYRSHFVQPPIYNSNHVRVQQVRYLYDRLLLLCAENSFKLLPFYDAPLKITPSKDRSAPLSQQAIPYYLDYPKLYRAWNYDSYRKGISDRHPAYFSPKQENTDNTNPTDDDLLYRLDAYNFYRIEGHIGKDKRDMLDLVRDYRRRWNLAFDVITLKIGKQVDIDDVDTFDDLDKSGQLDALKNDFQGVKDLFQEIWEIYNENWSNNVFLSTLKHVFFDQDELSDITLDQLYNPMLAAVRSDTDGRVYEFDPDLDANGQRTGKYRLYIRTHNVAGENRLAKFVFKVEQGDTPIELPDNEQDGTSTDLLNFSGLSDEEIAQRQEDISDLLSEALIADKVFYGLDQNAETPPQFYVCLTISDTFDLPIDPTNNTYQSNVVVKLISENPFTVSSTAGGDPPLIEQQEFQDFETLYGLLRDVPDDYAEQHDIDFSMGNHSAAVDYINAFDLKERIETYQKCAEQMMTPHLFHQFAQYHSGMEHLGGVPEGGTFILAYADDKVATDSLLDVYRSSRHKDRTRTLKNAASLPPAAPQELDTIEQDFLNWKNIVVADYCLPYRYWSNLLSSCHEQIQLRPIVLLEKTRFCASDSELYEFLLYPSHGNLKGEGSFFAAGKYYFQPSRVQPSITHDLAIAFTYGVNGCDSTLIITIHPLPNASFKLGASDKVDFCVNDAPITLLPEVLGGTFSIVETQPGDGDGEPPNEGASDTQSSSNVIQDNQFFPSEVELDGATEKVITLRYDVTSEYGCTNHLERDITVHALPDVDFSIGNNDDGSDITTFCANAAPVELSPEPPNGIFRAFDDDQDISARVLQGNRFLPSAVDLGGEDPKTITLEYSVTSDKGCTNRLDKEITIFALPDAGFQIGDEPNQNTFCANSDPVSLNPNQPGGTFKAMAGTTDISEDVLDLQTDPPQFLPREAALGTAKRMRITLIHEISRDIGMSQPCTHQSRQRVMIVALPNATFQVGPSDKTDFCKDDDPVTLIPWVSGGTFSIVDDGQPEEGEQDSTSSPVQGNQFDPSKVDLEGAKEKVITIKYEVTSEHGCTWHETKDITVHALPNADFKIGAENINSICADVASVELIPEESPNGVFRALDGNRDISARVLRDDRFLPSALSLGEADQKTITLDYTVTNVKGCTKTSAPKELTVYRVPVCNFDVELDEVSTIGFSVRVFNIQPSGNTTLTFNWQTPEGMPEPNEPTNEDFIIRYIFEELGDLDSVLITLEVSTPSPPVSCTSEPVTKTLAVPFNGVEAINLVTITSNTTSRTRLVNNQTLKMSDLTTNHTFEAVALGNVGSVIFTYTAPDGTVIPSPHINAATAENAPYYFMMLDANGRYWPWQPIVVGSHEINVRAFQEANGQGLEGVPLTITFTVTDDQDDSDDSDNPSGPTNPDESIPNGPTNPDGLIELGNEPIRLDIDWINRITLEEQPNQGITTIQINQSNAQNLSQPNVLHRFASQDWENPLANSVLSLESDRSLTLLDSASNHQSNPQPSSTSEEIDNVLSPNPTPSSNRHLSDSSSGSTNSLLSLLQGNTAEGSQESGHGLRTKLTWAATLSAIATLLILGWTGSLSNQSENPNSISRPNEIHNSTQ